MQAQEAENSSARLSPRELTIPPSPVFDMMGVTPSQVNRTSDIKDFKVDWSFKSWKLSPNLAIQSQPIWELLYHRRNLEKYQAASGFMRKLASLDLSIGSVQDENNDRRIGFSTKLNLYKQKDPLMVGELYAGISEKFQQEKEALELQLRELRQQLDSTKDILSRPAIREEIRATKENLTTLNTRRNEEINSRAKIFVAENWNASSLDIAFGRVNSYRTDSSGSLKNLRLNRNTGWSGWINGGFGLGKRILVSGLVRSSWYEEEVDFLLRNTDTGEEIQERAVADNTLLSIGMNIRYGGPLYSFFAEFFYERKGIKTALEALNEAFKAPGGFEVVGSSVNWNVVNPNSIAIGGDWRINRSVIINYGMRCGFDSNWKFTTFTPIASIACMMR